ncbi:AGAP006749-PA-like protein [Anopheles sinensis]|uniref:AGAP006749-PA-like protein n=1 Tax=Anopheles sinensis TaxID=74873 RepID=A0A084WLD8_ANOSI|nr:AGAP006749-PA-like protein [Anopheles sinensis]
MSPPYWIHCNLCYHVMVRKERKFYHLSCRHVLCKPCMAKTERGTTCPVCHQPLSRFSELNNQMERKEKMYYDPGAHKTFSDASQIAVFQLKQRENMVRGILRCRKAVPQMKEMFNTLRQRIVETQRQYEKYRTYRRNLQEIMRQQNSPAYGAPRAIRNAIVGQPQASLSIRASEWDSRSQLLTPASGRDRSSILGSAGFVPASGMSVFQTPLPPSTSTPRAGQPYAPVSEIGHNSDISGIRTPASSISSRPGNEFVRASGSSVYQTYPHPGTGPMSRYGPPKVPGSSGGGGVTFANDSGISGMRTPASTGGSRFSGSHGPSFPMTPGVATKRPHLFHYECPMPSKIARR